MPTQYEDTLRRLAAADPDLIVMTAENRAAIRSLPDHLGPRFIDVGIAEQTMIGMAAGLALRGRRPVVHALAAFLTMRAFEFIRTDVGIPGLPVTLVGYVPGLLSDGNGPTHQAIEDVALMGGIPGMRVFCPADEDELAAALPALLAEPGPCYIRYTGARPAPGRPPLATDLDPTRVEVIGGDPSERDDVAIVTYGELLGQALDAQARLAVMGVTARVLHARMPRPLDGAPVLAAARQCRLIVTVEDHLRAGGLHGALSALLVQRRASAEVMPIDLGARWFRPALLPEVLAHEGFTGGAIADRILGRLGRRGRRAPADPVIAGSQALWERARGLIPAGTQTLAKGPGQHVDGIAPKYVARGRGATVWDVDGNPYLDMTMAVGPLSLGYQDPVVDAAIRDQLADGITFSLMHPLEVEVAERLRRLVPGAEQVRFAKTGAEVTSAAVRLARAFTGRDRVVCCGYHGWHDWYIGVTDRDRGVPAAVADLVSTFAYNDLESLANAIDDDTACVILEPQVVEAPHPGFLAAVRRLCDQRGVILVFDEMWTGFRLALGGAQQHFGVTADLACFSKAIANGMPLAALTGRGDVMQLLERDVFFFSTFGGEALSLAAAMATLDELERRRIPEQLAARGRRLRDGLTAIAGELGIDWLRCDGMDCRTLLGFAPSAGAPLILRSFVQQELIRRGILWSGFHNLSAAHREQDIDELLAAYHEVLGLLAGHVANGTVADALRGAPVEAVFRRTSSFHTRPRGGR